jgi:hypothetical protein
MRMSPGIVGWACHGHFELKQLVVGFDVGVVDRPIDTHAITRVNLEIGGMEPGCERCPMYRTSADALSAVICSEGQWVGAPGDARLRPVEIVRTGFIANPVAFCIPEGPSFQSDHVGQHDEVLGKVFTDLHYETPL